MNKILLTALFSLICFALGTAKKSEIDTVKLRELYERKKEVRIKIPRRSKGETNELYTRPAWYFAKMKLIKAKQDKDEVGICECLYNLGELGYKEGKKLKQKKISDYDNSKSYNESIKYYKRFFKDCVESEDMVLALSNMVHIHIYNDDMSGAVKYFKKLLKDHPTFYRNVYTYKDFIEYYASRDKHSKAEKYRTMLLQDFGPHTEFYNNILPGLYVKYRDPIQNYIDLVYSENKK
jgi:tetratricopeptide (TPR) repeat protein